MTDSDPHLSAVSLIDRHVVKMPLESAQLLSTAHRLLDGKEFIGESRMGKKMKRWKLDDHRDDVIYLASHVNNPLAIWARTTIDNYNWLLDHMFGLLYEYSHRYKRAHKIEGDLSYLLSTPPNNLKKTGLTKMPVAMDPKFAISSDIMTNYRNYYNKDKRYDSQNKPMMFYTNREAPEWLSYNDVVLSEVKIRNETMIRKLYI